MRRWIRITPVLLLAAVGFGLLIRPGLSGADLQRAAVAEEARQGPGTYQQLQKDGRLLTQILQEVYSAYYRPVDSHDVTVSGLKGMMNQLDPYSEFYVEERDEGAVADLEITTSGTYSGIGATIGSVGGELSIVAPMKGSPAERAGLMAGDRIVRIDGTPSRNFSTAKAASMIKGPEGTEVELFIEREGFPEPLEFPIIRETIEVNDVQAAVFAAPGVAYIEIGRFTRNTGRFLVEAIERLSSEQKVDGLILDLRGNPGGLLDEALAVAEPFLPRGEMVVFTKGRIPQMNEEYRTSAPQTYSGRMAILVNGASASASEIVAGALQDLDRAVVVGQTTFGKGLVQSVAPIPSVPGAFMRLTTGEYFTPSGRSLQRPFVEDEMGRPTLPSSAAPDTGEHPIHLTRGGREVTGGGGVVPDIEKVGITGNVLLFDLKFRRGMFLRYVNNYVNTRDIQEGAVVEVDDALIRDFREWCDEQGFTFQTATEIRLEDLRASARAEESEEGLRDELSRLTAAIQQQKERMWRESTRSIALELRREFTSRLSGYDAGQIEYMKDDPQFQVALDLLKTPTRYAAILKGDRSGGSPDTP